jgi:release factor glutamine methyltransferase
MRADPVPLPYRRPFPMLLPAENSFRAYRQLFRDLLSPIYGLAECDAIFRLVVEERIGKQWSHGLLGGRFTESDINRISPVLEELTTGRPVQYALGYADFMGCRIRVDGRVLIPRPETEELCGIILRENPKDRPLRVLDIGTGSGCIPIALKKNAPLWHVSALDVDSGALELAGENAAANGTDVRFLQRDILTMAALDEGYDIIVSNPPYVAEHERDTLMEHVAVHEPHLALFVPDTDTLLFYRAIARLAKDALTGGGRLYLEINERFGRETLELVETTKFTDASLIQDLSGKDRFVAATAP